jgi:hypothetical protein
MRLPAGRLVFVTTATIASSVLFHHLTPPMARTKMTARKVVSGNAPRIPLGAPLSVSEPMNGVEVNGVDLNKDPVSP